MPYSGRGSTGQGIYTICKINTLFLSGASQFFKATMILKITFPMQSIVGHPLKSSWGFRLHTANTFKQELIMQINYFSGSMTTNPFIFVVAVVVPVSAIVIIITVIDSEFIFLYLTVIDCMQPDRD